LHHRLDAKGKANTVAEASAACSRPVVRGCKALTPQSFSNLPAEKMSLAEADALFVEEEYESVCYMSGIRGLCC